MPSKLQLDVNLWFLYVCLQKSDYKAIDFTAVGQAANINPPAARMRFTRLKKAIESGALNCPAGTILAGGTESIASASLPGGHMKGKGQAKKLQRAKAPTKPKSDNKVKDCTPVLSRPDLPSNTTEQRAKMEIDDDGDCTMKDGNTLDGVYNRYAADDDDDVPLAIIRNFALARKRHADSQMATGDIKRTRVGLEHQNQMPAVRPGAPFLKLNGATEDVEIVGVGQAGVYSGISWGISNHAQSQNGALTQGGTTNEPMGSAINPMFRPLPLRAWQDCSQQSMPQTTTVDYQTSGNQIQATARLLNKVAPHSTAASQAAPPGFCNVTHITDSPADTISISSSSPPASPVAKPAAPKNLPLQYTDTLCTRYPGLQDTTNQRCWRNYRLPHIVVTDMEPDAPRNWLYPRSPVAIGKAERTVNEALFGPSSAAFGRKPDLVHMAEERPSGETGDATQYLEIPRVALEENPQGQNRPKLSERNTFGS